MAGRIALWLVIIAALVFAIQGGEYSTLDLWKQRQLKKQLTQVTDSLAKHVDSLKREARLLKTDPATQERVARERFGMVRGSKEILYRIDTVDSSGR